jgi:WD40 repeat protein
MVAPTMPGLGAWLAVAIIGLAWIPLDDRQAPREEFLGDGQAPNLPASPYMEPTATSDRVEAILGLTFSPDGGMLATADHEGRAALWDVATGEPIQDESLPSRDVSCLTFLAERDILALCMHGGRISLWDVAGGHEIFGVETRFRRCKSVAASPDGRWIVVGSNSGRIACWDLEARRQLQVDTGHGGAVTSLGFSRDGRRFASGGSDGTVAVWDLSPSSGGEPRRVAFQPRDASRDRAIRCVAFTPDGSRLAWTAMFQEGITLRDVEAGPCMRIPAGHGASCLGVAFSPEGRRLATCGTDGAVRLWDVETGREIETWLAAASNPARWIWSIAFAPDGRTVAAVGNHATPLFRRLGPPAPASPGVTDSADHHAGLRASRDGAASWSTDLTR